MAMTEQQKSDVCSLGGCVEAARSGVSCAEGVCLEVGESDHEVVVRDTKPPVQGPRVLTPEESAEYEALKARGGCFPDFARGGSETELSFGFRFRRKTDQQKPRRPWRRWLGRFVASAAASIAVTSGIELLGWTDIIPWF